MAEPKTKKQIITIAGRPGSGKSTTAKKVASRLDFKHFSSGDLFRELGKQRGVTVLEGNMTPGVTEELDRLVDSKLRQIGQKGNYLVIDSRTAWHWIPGSFKVFLNLDMRVAAQRIIEELNEARTGTEHIVQDADEYAAQLQKRLDIEAARYKTLYDINPYDISNYDLVVDTAENDINQTIQLVLDAYRDWLTS